MKKNYILCGLTALLVGCSLGDESFDVPTSFSKIDKVRLSVDPYEYADEFDTRSTLVFTGSNFKFGWANGDSLGMFPVSPAGSQVYQVLEDKEEESVLTYTFDGGAWTIKSGNSYVGYYPFKSEMKLAESFDAIPVNMVGQKQNGKNSTSHLGDFDYMFTDVTAVGESEDNVNFQFHHIGSIVQANLTVPVAKTWKKLVFEAESDVFVTKALMNAVEGAFKSVVKTNTIELDLEDVSSSVNEQLTFYFEVLPTTVGAITVTAIDADGIYYTGNISFPDFSNVSSITMNSGKAYRWNATLSEADEYAGKDYVLLAGSLWCRYNLNLSGDTNGEYYAWGETSTKSAYEWSNYKFGTSADALGYYTPGSFPYTSLRDRDDVALTYMPASGNGHWRIPTRTEMQQLIDNCSWVWDSKTNSYKVSDPNNSDRYIYLPATSCWGDVLYDMFTEGFYWTRDVETDDDLNWSCAYYLYFDDSSQVIDTSERCYGMMIRPVYVNE